MVTLDELRQITNNKESKFDKYLEKAKKEEIAKYEKQFIEATYNLSHKLRLAAEKGKRYFTVAEFSAFGYGLSQILNDNIKSKQQSSGNYFCAWRDKKITEKDVIENMIGNLKRVYEFAKENGLEPYIDYWADGGGMDEGFCVKIKW